MCGIAGIIYADANGGALFGPHASSFVMRFKLADANDPRDFEFADRIQRNRFLVEQRLRRFGAQIHDLEEETEYAFRVTFDYTGDLKQLADLVEDVPGAEVLSLGHALEIVKDLGDAESV